MAYTNKNRPGKESLLRVKKYQIWNVHSDLWDSGHCNSHTCLSGQYKLVMSTSYLQYKCNLHGVM